MERSLRHWAAGVSTPPLWALYRGHLQNCPPLYFKDCLLPPKSPVLRVLTLE